jgi:hypothetical protein
MRTANVALTRLGFSLGLLCGLALLSARTASSQGCAPSRFNFQGSRRAGDVSLGRGTWQLALAYRHLTSNRLIQGGDDVGPGTLVKSQSIFTSLTYGVSDHLAVTLTMPFSDGSHERQYADGQRHKNTLFGLNDISLGANYSLFSAQRLGGNLGFGLGVKIPTGKNDAIGTWWNKNGTSISFPAHQSIQLGDGGWGLSLSVAAFQPLSSRFNLEGAAVYTLNPKKTTDVRRSPTDSTRWAVPDTWGVIAGVGFEAWPAQGLSASLEIMVNGTPRRDLIGGADGDGYRLPATVGYLNPAIQVTRGVHRFTLGVPLRVYKDFKPSYVDEAAGTLGGGGLAKYIILAQYLLRF